MTNFEKIKGMTLEELAEFLMQLDIGGRISDTLYCRTCKHNTAEAFPFGCDIPDNEKLPCEDLTPDECIRRWLEYEV